MAQCLKTHSAVLEDLSSMSRFGGSQLAVSPGSEALPRAFMRICTHIHIHTTCMYTRAHTPHTGTHTHAHTCVLTCTHVQFKNKINI